MTTPMIRAYTSDVYAVAPSICCAVATIAISAAALTASRAPIGVTMLVTLLITVMALVFALLSARVRVTATPDEVSYRVGFGRWRVLSRSAVRNSACVHVGVAAIVGIGIPPSRSTARHIVRAGPVLHLEIQSGEQIWLSVTGPLPEDMTTHPAPSITEETASR